MMVQVRMVPGGWVQVRSYSSSRNSVGSGLDSKFCHKVYVGVWIWLGPRSLCSFSFWGHVYNMKIYTIPNPPQVGIEYPESFPSWYLSGKVSCRCSSKLCTAIWFAVFLHQKYSRENTTLMVNSSYNIKG